MKLSRVLVLALLFLVTSASSCLDDDPPATPTIHAAFDWQVVSGNTIRFIDRTIGGKSSGNVFHWFFGDGTESNERNPIHTYAQCGVYVVKLRVAPGTRQWAERRAREAEQPIIIDCSGGY